MGRIKDDVAACKNNELAKKLRECRAYIVLKGLDDGSLIRGLVEGKVEPDHSQTLILEEGETIKITLKGRKLILEK